MKRVIVDYAKLTNEILNLLVDRFPDGYDDSNIVRFRNAQNELIEAVEVNTVDTIYLVKVSTKLASRLEKFEDDIDDIVEPIDSKVIDLHDEDASNDDDEENDLAKDSDDSRDSDDDDDDDDDIEDSGNDDDDDEDE